MQHRKTVQQRIKGKITNKRYNVKRYNHVKKVQRKMVEQRKKVQREQVQQGKKVLKRKKVQ